MNAPYIDCACSRHPSPCLCIPCTHLHRLSKPALCSRKQALSWLSSAPQSSRWSLLLGMFRKHVFLFQLPDVLPRPLWNGTRIVPTGIKQWLQKRGLHWSCFCALIGGSSTPSRIVESLQGDVLIFCHHDSSRCGFFSMFIVALCAVLFSLFFK